MTTAPINPDLPRAFRETTLGLIGVFQVYEVNPDLALATAEVLGRLFRRHLGGLVPAAGTGRPHPLQALADELERLAKPSLAKPSPAAGSPTNGG